jgi:SAM-dependent methyltransferase
METPTVPRIVDYVVNLVAPMVAGSAPVEHLDIGAGWGHLIAELRKRAPNVHSQGCDYNPQHNQTPGLVIKHVDLNNDALPFADASFDLITCTEVIEHVENFRRVIREIARVARPGARVIISTPNVLNLRSRWYFFTRGFYEYFDPLPLRDDPRFYPGERHITPIPYFYLAHALREYGFEQIAPHNDKPQRLSQGWLPLLGPLCRWVEHRSLQRRRRKLRPLSDEIEALASGNNAAAVLTGRTLIVTARRVGN